MAKRKFTEQELRAILYRIAQTYLEVERGLRPPEHLKAFLTPREYMRHRARPRPLHRPEGPVQHRDLGRIHLERPTGGQITASVILRQPGDRWGVLVVHLQDTGTGWMVDQLERLERTPRALAPREVQPPESDDIADRIRYVEIERRVVSAARIASATWLEELEKTSGRDGDHADRVRQVREQLGTWTRRSDALDQELETLNRTATLRGALAVEFGTEAGVDPSTSDGFEHIRGVLGERPDESKLGALWDEAAAELGRYRERWQISDVDHVLGLPTDDSAQSMEWELLVLRLRETIAELGKGSRRHELERDTRPTPDLCDGVDLLLR